MNDTDSAKYSLNDTFFFLLSEYVMGTQHINCFNETIKNLK